jgi:bifunctional non-homologous end joining protein LigD
MLFRPSPGARPAGFVEPCIPTQVPRPPTGTQWVHEIKHDGCRLIARKQDGRVRLFTRRGYDWTDRYPLVAKAVAALRVGSATIDGEAVCCDARGVSVFDDLHSRRHDDRVILYAFDLLEQRACRRRRPNSLRARLQARAGGHRLQAPRAPVPLGPVQDLAQGQEPEGAGRDAV